MPSTTLVQFAAAAVISYLGLLAGFFLASLTREELPIGKKYFPLLQRIIILMIAAAVLNFFSVNVLVKLVAYAILLMLLIIRLNTQLFYAIFGVALFGVSKDQNALLIIASLVFLFGVVSGSAYFNPTVRRKAIFAVARETLVTNLAYVIIALALFLAAASF